MQTEPNTERFMVTVRGYSMAIRLDTLRVFDYLSDAIEYADKLGKADVRMFRIWNDKRAKEIKEWK